MRTDADRRDAAVDGHRSVFGTEPSVVAFAPGRVNLMGDHTDYNGGLALPVALDVGTTCAIALTASPYVEIHSTASPGPAVRVPVADTLEWRERGWSSYVVGSLMESGAITGPGTGATVWIDGDVPVGAGLSSSASVECAVLVAATAAAGGPVDRWTIALAAQRAEHRYAGVPCGILDQATSMLGEPGSALLLDSDALVATAVPLPLATWQVEVLIINTRVHHELADGGYADRRASCERAANQLGVRRLVDVTVDRIGELEELGEPERRRARHVVSENARVSTTVEAFASGDLDAVGSLFRESHRSLAEDFEVSCTELDLAVTAALSAGALGARMTGGGFGGSVIALVAAAEVDRVIEHVCHQFSSNGLREPHLLTVSPSAGARVLLGDVQT